MKILVTGADGFAGKNLVENLMALRDGKNRTRPQLHIREIVCIDRDTEFERLDQACSDCDFVFHFAGVNRTADPAEFHAGNVEALRRVLDRLRKHGNPAPVMYASSVQASLSGRFGVTEYGVSKRDGEELLNAYSRETGARVLAYRFPNLAGKGIRPGYNSAVGTFCYQIARDQPVTVNDPDLEITLVFIDDLIEEMLDALEGREHRCDFSGTEPVPEADGPYCYVPVSHKASLGYIVECLRCFRAQPDTLRMPALPEGSFEKKLYSMYLSYLPKEKVAFDLASRTDSRGSFTELMKTADHGQFSLNVTGPGQVKGQHWHNSKWEMFIVVSGHGLIRERRLGSKEIWSFEVDGKRLQAVHMLPGFTHEIVNLSESEDLVTLIWANEPFDPAHPDTFFEPV